MVPCHSWQRGLIDENKMLAGQLRENKATLDRFENVVKALKDEKEQLKKELAQKKRSAL